MTDEDTWSLVCSTERFEELKGDPAFGALVALARCVNQLRFLHGCLEHIPAEDDSPEAARQQTATLLAVAAALKEGVALVRERMGQHFRNTAEFPVLTELFKDTRFRALIQEGMPAARNGFVAHFLEDLAVAEMADVRFADECVFVVGRGRTGRHAQFRLADTLAMLALSRGVPGATLEERTKDLGSHLGELSVRFVAGAERLLIRALRDRGFQARRCTAGHIGNRSDRVHG